MSFLVFIDLFARGLARSKCGDVVGTRYWRYLCSILIWFLEFSEIIIWWNHILLTINPILEYALLFCTLLNIAGKCSIIAIIEKAPHRWIIATRPKPIIEKIPEAKHCLSMKELKIRKDYHDINPRSNQISEYSRISRQQQLVGLIRGS